MRSTALLLSLLGVNGGFVAPIHSARRCAACSSRPAIVAILPEEEPELKRTSAEDAPLSLPFDPAMVALGIAALAAFQPEAVMAKGGEFGIFEGRIVSLAHPAMMVFVYGASAYSAFTGWQWRQLRQLRQQAY